jgi:hypothetical protein
METQLINKKKLVVVEKRKLGKIQLITIRKVPEEKRYTLAEGREMAHKLIDKWANGK